jgi:hypothetical protein
MKSLIINIDKAENGYVMHRHVAGRASDVKISVHRDWLELIRHLELVEDLK